MPRRGSESSHRELLGPVATLAVLEVRDRPEEVEAGEARPKDVGEIELRVRRLPEQEVRDPLFAARPEDQVGVRQVPGIETLRYGGVLDAVRLDPPGLNIASDGP